MGMYFECELNKIDIDEVLSTVRYIEPEDLVVLYREKIRRLESALKNSEDDNIRRSEMNKELSDKVECLGNNNRELLKENGRLKEELQLVCENYNAFNEDAKQLVEEKKDLEESSGLEICRLMQENKRLRADLEESHANSIRLVAELRTAKNVLVEANKKLLNSRFGLQSMQYHDLMMENRRLLQEQASLETQINILNAVSDGYKDDIDKLMHENEKLKKSKMMCTNQLMATVHSRNKYRHLYEQLKASSDLSMTAELAEIFAEFTDKDKENRDDLSVKIDEFREKYQFE